MSNPSHDRNTAIYQSFFQDLTNTKTFFIISDHLSSGKWQVATITTTTDYLVTPLQIEIVRSMCNVMTTAARPPYSFVLLDDYFTKLVYHIKLTYTDGY